MLAAVATWHVMSLVFLTSDEESATGVITAGAQASTHFMTSSDEEPEPSRPKANRAIKKKPAMATANLAGESVAKKPKTLRWHPLMLTAFFPKIVALFRSPDGSCNIT